MGVGFSKISSGLKTPACFILLSLLVVFLLSSSVFAAGPVVSDANLLDSTQAKAANYFYEQSLNNGFVKDTINTPYASIAATGFGLAAFPVMAQRYGTTPNWTYTPAQLRARTNQILDNIIAIQSGQVQNPSLYGTHGMMYHFINYDNSVVSGSEVSTIDSALLFAGVITAGEYFGSEVKQKANTIIGAVDWSYFQKTPENNFTTKDGNANMYQFTMSWSQGGGYSIQPWDRPTDEAILVSVMALATNPANLNYKKSLFSWDRVTQSYAGYNVVNSYFGSLFSYEFAHFFIDFNKIGLDVPAGINPSRPAVNWWQNSINAAKANRQFCIDKSGVYSSYGPDSWGLSAAYRPNGSYFGNNGALPTGTAVAVYDGTVAPYSSISTMPFFKAEDGGVLANNLGFRVLRNAYDTRYDKLWGIYGPTESFNEKNEASSLYLGLDQGPIVLSLENYRTGLVMNQFMKNDSIKAALKGVFTCPNGVCDTTVTCSLNTQCNDNNALTTDTCVNPGTSQSSCTHTLAIACSQNSECNDYNFMTDDSCVNPGTPSSYCTFNPNGQTCVTPSSGMQITQSTNFCSGAYYAAAISIAADNVVLDCKGASISTGSGTMFSIAGRSNVTIKNCQAQGANYILSITDSNSITISDNNFLGTWDSGIWVNDANKLVIRNNRVTGNQYRNGLELYYVNDSNIENNDLSYSGTVGNPWGYAGGIRLSNSSRNRVINNTMNNGYHGAHITVNSNDNYFSSNKMCYNSQDNYCSGSTGNTASGNTLPGANSACSWLATGATSCDQTCTDTDDGSIFLKGTVTYWNGLTTTTLTDTCENDANYLREYMCVNMHPYTGSYTYCSNGCLNGACLSIACSSDGLCNDNNANTLDTCINPGTFQSACTYTTIACIDNSQCNDNNASTQDTCVSPGTISSACTHTPLAIACSTNAQCGTNAWVGINFCNVNNIWGTFRAFTCNNAGTPQSSCSLQDANQLKTACSSGQLCNNATCVTPICSTNTQCDDNNALTNDICMNPGTITSSCTHTPVPITCSQNLDCGPTQYSDTNMCIMYTGSDANKMSDKIIHENIVPMCSNPGTPESSCTDTYGIIEEVVATCPYGCLNGACKSAPIACSNNTQCNDNNASTTDTCINSGTVNSYCQNIKPAIVCSTNTQCGTNGFVGTKSCSGLNLLQSYRTYTCVSPGTASSSCKYAEVTKTASTCLSTQVCSNGACITPVCRSEINCGTNGYVGARFCSGKSVQQLYRTFACSNAATINASCSYKDTTKTLRTCELNQTCSNGACVQDAFWAVAPTYTGKVFGSATCNVSTQSICPPEMGWEGNKVTYAFTAPDRMPATLNLVFDVPFRNYGNTKDVVLRVSAGKSTTSLVTINAGLVINRLGTFTVPISSSLFKAGTASYIQLYGTNITPIGYGTNPPNFKISSIALKTV